MRKILLGMLLAATAATPALADPGDNRDHRGGQRAEQVQRQREVRQDFRQNRAEMRRDFRQDRAETRRDFRQDIARQRVVQQDVRRDRPVAVRPVAVRPVQVADRRWDNDRRPDGDRRWGNDRRPDGNRNWNDGRRGDDGRRWDNNRRWDDRRADNRWDRDRHDGRWDNGRWDNGRRVYDPRFHGGGWNTGWRDDRRYDWYRHRAQYDRYYRLPRYYAPRGYGYGYRTWYRGYRADPYFYSSSYWINDPYYYRLPPAYGSYRWVRYYNDVALIDISNGIVADLITNFFL